MKKLLVALVLLLSSVFCFAETVVIEDEKSGSSLFDSKADGVLFSLGDVFYFSNRLDASTLPTWGGIGEVGNFKSDEDGLFDWVESETFGLSFGRVESSGKKINKSLSADGDAKYGNIFIKDVFGPQLNVAIVSFAFLFGTKAGFDWLKVSTSRNFTYKERNIFFDFVIEPYFSVNVNHMIKIYASTEWDLPLFRARFIKDSDRDVYTFQWDWFGDDVPVSYKVGAVFFF